MNTPFSVVIFEIPKILSGLPTLNSADFIAGTGDANGAWLTLPTAGRIRVFHPIERALTGRTKNWEKPLGVSPNFLMFLLS